MHIFNKSALLPVVFLVIFVIPAILPLFKPGLFTMHDDQQVVRLIQLDKSLKGGVFPVRWVADLGFGYGYPLFIFYPPLVYYLGEIYHLLFNLSFVAATKWVFATAFIGSALTMYLWAKRHFGKLPGLIAALFYIYVPYHAVDAYVRGALAELFSFVWLPLILLSIDHIVDSVIRPEQSRRRLIQAVLMLAGSFAALMMTHNLITLPFTIIMAIYALGYLVRSKPKNYLPLIGSFLIAGVLGLGLSAFFWIPALAEKQYTLVDQILLKERYSYALHFVCPSQLWNSLWGYGGSAPGCLDGMTFKIGKLHIVLSIITALFTLVIWFHNKAKKKSYRLILNTYPLILTISFLLAFSAFMTTSYSSLIWNVAKPIQYLQFPWRFLEFTALFSSFLVSAFAYLIAKFIKPKVLLLTTYFLLLALLLLPNLKLFQPQYYLQVTDAHYQSDQFTKWEISSTSFEFMPKGVSTIIDPTLDITQVNINQDQIAKTDYSVITGNPQIKTLISTPNQKQLNISTSDLTAIQFNTTNFPGWKLYLDQKPQTINDQNPLKLITTTVPAGKHILKLIFTDTPVRMLANIISLLSLICFALLILRFKLVGYGRRTR